MNVSDPRSGRLREAVAHAGQSHRACLLITKKGKQQLWWDLFKSKAASAPRPQAHGTNVEDKQGRVQEKCTQGTANRRPVL